MKASQRTFCQVITAVLVVFTALNARAQKDNPAYDKALADSLGADDYGMKMYILVMLKTGPASVTDKAKADSIFGGHMKAIKHLADGGKLVVAGPLQKNEKQYEGIFILNVKTTEEAKTLLNTDPAIRSGLLATELYGWYGSAALPLYLPAAEKAGRKKF